MARCILTKKSQVWALDLAVALIIFVSAIVLFYKYSINSMDAGQSERSSILLDAKLASSYLLSAGYPENWTASDVSVIGLTDGQGRLSYDRLSMFNSIALSDYTRSRRLLSIAHDYNVCFEQGNSTMVIKGIGCVGMAYDGSDVIKITRVVHYNSSIIRMVVKVW